MKYRKRPFALIESLQIIGYSLLLAILFGFLPAIGFVLLLGYIGGVKVF